MPYFTNIGPKTGPILWRDCIDAIGVLESPTNHTPIGMALGKDLRGEAAVAVAVEIDPADAERIQHRREIVGCERRAVEIGLVAERPTAGADRLAAGRRPGQRFSRKEGIEKARARSGLLRRHSPGVSRLNGARPRERDPLAGFLFRVS